MNILKRLGIFRVGGITSLQALLTLKSRDWWNHLLGILTEISMVAVISVSALIVMILIRAVAS
ncbi:MAG: hypothetical protein JW738_06810 [Actinobacteria bacterium]|nr:hypothetical protein [Actinomycetota bacterium]